MSRLGLFMPFTRSQAAAAASATSSAFETMMANLETTLQALQQSLQAFTQQFEAFEGRIDATDARFDQLETTLTDVLSRLPPPIPPAAPTDQPQNDFATFAPPIDAQHQRAALSQAVRTLPPLPKFSGTETALDRLFEHWIEAFELRMSCCNVPPVDHLKFLMSSLEGAAFQAVYTQRTANPQFTFLEAKTLLERRFSLAKNPDVAYMQLHTTHWDPQNESIEDFGSKLLISASRALGPNVAQAVVEILASRQFKRVMPQRWLHSLSELENGTYVHRSFEFGGTAIRTRQGF